MSTAHTREPWFLELDSVNGGLVVVREAREICRISESIDHKTAIEDACNATRIVDCVNACEGMATPADDIAILLKAIEACEQSLAQTECTGLKQLSTGLALDIARAAINQHKKI